MSFGESAAVFKARAKDIGVSDESFAKLEAEGLTTMATFAFCCHFNPSEMSCFRRLFAEAYATVASDIRSQVEATEDSSIKKLAPADRAERLREQQSRLKGLDLRGNMEPGDSLIDRAVAIYESDRLQYVEWQHSVSRQHELLTGLKKDASLTLDSAGGLKIASKPNVTPCDVSTDMMVRYALVRRGLAFEQANILAYHLHDELLEKYMSFRLMDPPPNHARVSLKQIEQADRQFTMLLAEHTRGGIKVKAGGSRPCDGGHIFVVHPEGPDQTFYEDASWAPDLFWLRLPWVSTDSAPLTQPSPAFPSAELPADGPLVIELCAGSAILSQTAASRGFAIMPVDHAHNRHTPKCKMVNLDLTQSHSWEVLKFVIKSRRVAVVFAAPPCGTCSAARHFRPGPPVLRTTSHPWGVPWASTRDCVKLKAANAIYKQLCAFLELCDQHSVPWCVENPTNSTFWELPCLAYPLAHGFFAHCQACAFGSERDKKTSFLCSSSGISRMALMCPGCKQHATWGLTSDDTFATAEEAAYPPAMCQALCDVFESDAYTHSSCQSTLQFYPASCPGSPESFVREAKLLYHPFDSLAQLPDYLIKSLFEQLTKSPAEICKLRLLRLQKWRARATELAPVEHAHRAKMQPSVKEILANKRTALLEEMAAEIDWPDKGLFSEMRQGFRLVGCLSPSGVFREGGYLASISESELMENADSIRASLLARVSADPLDENAEELYDVTLQEATQKKWLDGPMTPGDIGKRFEAWIPVRRFCVVQKGRLRPIDDFKENLVNQASRPKTGCCEWWVAGARRYGFTNYKGRTVDEGDLLGAYTSNQQQVSEPKHRSDGWASTSESSLSLLSWNCGGLGNLQDECLTWLDSQPFHVVCLQETWFRSHMDFHTRGWQCINSGIGEQAKRAHAGVMILFRSSAFNMQSLRFHHVVPGRVLHAKVFGKGLGWIEVVNVYQYVWERQSEQSTTEAKRAVVWDKVRATLGQIPQGSTLVMCGDFNTTIAKRLPYAGSGMLRKSQPSPDADSLEELQSDFGCVAVNSFGRVDSHTYIHEGYAEARRSFVDFIFLRRRKHRLHKATLLRNFEVGRWRKGGRHLPVRVDFTLRPYHSSSPAVSTAAKWPAWKCKLLTQAVKEAPELAEQFRQTVAASLEQVSAYRPQELNQVLLDAGDQVFQIKRPSCLRAPAEDPEHVGTIRQMWEHYRCMRQLSPGNFTNRTLLRNAVQAWRHWFQFHRMHKIVQKRSRQLRRKRLDELLTEAQAHERSGCTSAIFDILRRHAPKQPRRRAQLRSDTGKLLTPNEETKVLLDFWKGVNGGIQHTWQASSVTVQYDITRDELAQALQQLQARKSAPKHCAPHAFWNLAAHDIADFMDKHVFEAWRQGEARVFSEWAAAWLVFLGKVGKAGDSPAHLRPIALLEPMGKALAGVLKQPWVSSFSTVVRFEQQLWHRADRFTSYVLVPSAVPTALRELILQWVEATSFYIGNGADAACYSSDKGFRQGCKLSPTLWVCVSVYVLRALDGVLSSGWSKQHTVGFADDLHFRWRFDDVAGLLTSLEQAGIVLSKLQQLKLKISVDKTVCLLRADGVQAPHALRKIIRKTKHGKLLRLDMNWEMPLKKSHIYLGACISYENFEKQNMLHRLQACKAAFCRLRPTLMAHRALSMHKRLMLWKVTVVTSAFYSLLASGFTAKIFDMLRVVLTRQARAIARSPRHLDLESDDCFWHRIQIDPPATMLRLRLEKAIATTTSLADCLQSTDARIAPELRAHEQAVLAELQEITSPTKAKGATDDGEHICIECGARFGTGAALRAHIAKNHSEQRMQMAQETIIEFDRHRHGKDGMPTCAGCLHRFDRWADLEKHIVENHCQATPDQAEPPATAVTRTVMQLVQDGDFSVSDLSAGAITPTLRDELRQHCALCRQWHPNAKYFKRLCPASMDNVNGVLNRTMHLSLHEAEPEMEEISFPEASDRKRWNNRLNRESNCCAAAGLPNSGQHVSSVKVATARNSSTQMPVLKFFRMLLHLFFNNHRLEPCVTPPARHISQIKMEDSQVAAAFSEVFGPVLGKRMLEVDVTTAQQDRPTKTNKPGAPKGKGKGKGKKKYQASRFSSSANGSNEEPDWYAEAIALMSRMLIRQEDVMAVLRQSTGWVWWLRVPAPTVVPDLFQAAQVWKKEIANPQSPMTGTSLRSALLWCILHKLCLTMQAEDQAQIDLAMKNGWCTKDQMWVYQAWSPARQQLEVDESRAPIPTSSVIQLLTDMKTLVSGDTVSRFHATRPLAEQMSGQVLTMVMDVSFRKASANELYGELEKLQGLAALQLCGVQFRKEGFKRSPAAQRLLELMGLLWTMADHLDSSAMFTKTGREALRLILQHKDKPVHIFGIPIWRMLLHSWGAPQSQHDAAEFLAFLLDKLHASTFTWDWEARIGNDVAVASEVADRGNSRHAITLDLPGQEGPYDLQILANAWHEQARTHALTGDATLLIFRLARYRQEGDLVRNNCAVTWSSKVYVPVFDGQGNSSVAQKFAVQAVIMHHGNTLTCGHYTIMLHAPDSAFFCDDGAAGSSSGQLLTALAVYSGDADPAGVKMGLTRALRLLLYSVAAPVRILSPRREIHAFARRPLRHSFFFFGMHLHYTVTLFMYVQVSRIAQYIPLLRCNMSPASPMEWTLRDGVVRIQAPWFETTLTPELYYFDPRAVDQDSCASADCDPDVPLLTLLDASDAMSASSEASLRSDGFDIPVVPYIPVHLYDSNDHVNKFAFDCLHRGFVSFNQLRVLCELLPPDNKPRKHVLSDAGLDNFCLEPRCFTTGAYVFGGNAGVRSNLAAFPWVAKLLCDIVRNVAGDKPYTTVSLTLNWRSGVHVDAHNSRVFHNILIPAGCWDGGELWLADVTGTVAYPGTLMLGNIQPIRHPYVSFDATHPHAVMPWVGERVMICAFHIRDAWRLGQDHLLSLQEAGFSVATCEHDTDPYM
ncbi:unnamed protein product [Symbiodinium sp. CCMP2592]|nr:unnamed protein product [Symbiodinium sp. CCMP2592]